jgi:hypothetical protein
MTTYREAAAQGAANYKGKVQTTNATVTDVVFGDGNYTLNDNEAGLFTVRVVGRNIAGDESAGYVLQGVFDRKTGAGTTAIVGTVNKLAIEDAAVATAWDANVVADTAAGGIKVQVTGEASKNIDWTATVTYVTA